MARIDSDADQNKEAVLARSLRQASATTAQFDGVRASLSACFGASLASLSAATNQTRATSTGSLQETAATVQGLASRAIALGTELGTEAVRDLGAGVTTTLQGATAAAGTAAQSILSVAGSISIPDLPGLGWLRGRILGAAQGLVGNLQAALATVEVEVEGVVASAVSVVESTVSSAGDAIQELVAGIIQGFLQAQESIETALGGFEQQSHAVLTGPYIQVGRASDEMELTVQAAIDELRTQALADIEESRSGGKLTIGEILEFAFAHADYPADEGVIPFLDILSGTNDPTVYNGALLRAFEFVVSQAVSDNADTLKAFSEDVADLITDATQQATSLLDDIREQLLTATVEAAAKLASWVSAAAKGISQVLGLVKLALSGTTSVLERALRELVRRAFELATRPGQLLSAAASSLSSALLGFLQGLLGKLLRGGIDESVSLDGMPTVAAPPVTASIVAAPAAPVVVGGIALSTILWHVGLLILFLLLMYLLYKLVTYLYRTLTRPRTKTRTKSRIKSRDRRKVRRRTRRARKCRRPLTWNAGITVKKAAHPGALDSCLYIPRLFPWHAHHTWPKFVGGCTVQPLMGVRGYVHLSILHPALYAKLKLDFPKYRITTSTIANTPFIWKLATDRALRNKMTFKLLEFYGVSFLAASPPIPLFAYASGIFVARMGLGGP